MKIDICSKHKIKEIKTSRKEKISHEKQLKYYIYYLKKYYKLDINKGELLYPKIKSKKLIDHTKEDEIEMEEAGIEILRISETDLNLFQIDNKEKFINETFL